MKQNEAAAAVLRKRKVREEEKKSISARLDAESVAILEAWKVGSRKETTAWLLKVADEALRDQQALTEQASRKTTGKAGVSDES